MGCWRLAPTLRRFSRGTECWPPRSPRGLHRMTRNPGSRKSPTGKPQAGQPDREALGPPGAGSAALVQIDADTRCRPGARVVTGGQRHVWMRSMRRWLTCGSIARAGVAARPALTGFWRTRPFPGWRSAPRCVAPRPRSRAGQPDHRASPPGQQRAATGVRHSGMQDPGVEAAINKLHETRAVAAYDGGELVNREVRGWVMCVAGSCCGRICARGGTVESTPSTGPAGTGCN
jgi:hypothetical protein